MERSKRSRRAVAAGRVTVQSQPALANIEALIDSGGQITIGATRPVKCAAIANDEHDCLVMLQRKPGETLQHLLERLDAAIDLACRTGQFTDEINT